MTLAWDPSTDPTVVGYRIYYGVGSRDYSSYTDVGNVTTATVTGLSVDVTYYFAATAFNPDGLESDFSNEVTYRVPTDGQNQPPTLDPLPAITISENSGTQVIDLTGITSGSSSEFQVLTVTAVSSNPEIVPNPSVKYVSANTTGSIVFAPLPYANGTATITVTVDDGQVANHSISRSFVVTVTPVNQPPTLSPIANVSLPENTAQAVVPLTGLSSGAPNENQFLTVTAISSSPALIPNPTVTGVNQGSTATLVLNPAPNRTGTAIITVTVDDGGSENHSTSQSFTVVVGAYNQPPTLGPIADITVKEDAGPASVQLSDITSGAPNEWQTLTVRAVSSNPSLIPNPTVAYLSPSQFGTLSFTPVADASGMAVITVTVDDGHTISNLVSRSFQVTVTPVNDPPTLSSIANVTMNENDPTRSIMIWGISAGPANETQTLTVTATSSDRKIIPDPVVKYQSPQWIGILEITPVPYAFGTVTITVTVSDGGQENGQVTQTFVVTVNPVNQAPTLDPIPNLPLDSNAGQQVVTLTGITSGAINEVQPLTVTATSSNPSVVPNPVVNYFSPQTSGALSFTPGKTSGSATITVTVDDGQLTNNIFSRSFVVSVNLANQPPTLASLSDMIINEDAGEQLLMITGISSGSGSESQTLKVTATSSNPKLIPNPTVSYFSPNTMGVLSFTPQGNAYGTATISVTVDDGYAINNTITRSFQVTVQPVNDPPSLNAIGNITINENAGAQVINLVAISAGPNENQPLTVTATSSDPNLIPNPAVNYASPNDYGTLTFTPATNAFGSATITVTVDDGQDFQNVFSRSFTVVVNPVNQPPTLAPLADVTFDRNAGEVAVALSGISSGAANENQTLAVTAFSSNPSVVLNPTVNYASPGSTGTLVLKPGAASGTATITVTVNDGQAANNLFSRSFEVTVSAANFPPTLSALPDLTIPEDAGLQTVQLLGISSGSPNENQRLTITAVSSNPALILNPVLAYSSPVTSGTLSFIPVANAFGTATITVTVDDGAAFNNSTSRSFNVIVTPVNDPPELNPLQDLVINQDSGPTVVSLSGIGPGATNEFETVLITAKSSNPAILPDPVVAYSSPNTTGTVTLSPATNAFGTATVTVTVDDGQAVSHLTTRSFTVTVKPLNRAPTLDPLANMVLDTTAGQQVVFLSGISSGSQDEEQYLTVTASSSNPSVIPNPTVSYQSPSSVGSLTFAPGKVSGSATITVTVDDGEVANHSFTRSFVINLNHVNQPPTLDALANITMQENGAAQKVTLSGITSGSENEHQVLTVTAFSSNPDVVPDPVVSYRSPDLTGVLTVLPVPDASGSATIWVTVNDGDTTQNTITRSFTVLVNPVNQPPTLDPIPEIVLDQNAEPQDVPLAGITSGSAKENDTLRVLAVSSNPRLIPNPGVSYRSPDLTGRLTLYPVPGAFGSVLITVTVDDGAASNSAVSRSFLVTINPVNQAPTLDPIADVTIKENASPLMFSLTGISSGATNEFQKLTVTATSSNPTLIPNPRITYTSPADTASLTVTPVPYGFGTATITVKVNDGQEANNSVTRSFVVTVLAVNQAPTFNPLPDLTVDENAGTQVITLAGVTAGAANETEPVTVTATSSNPALIPAPMVSYMSPASSGTLSFTPALYASGQAIITVTADDGQPTNNVFSRSFRVTVNKVNQPPTIDLPSNLVLTPNSGPQSVTLTGISSGSPNESDALIVTASTSNPSLVTNLLVSYASPQTTGLLRFGLVKNAAGKATITVAVSDGHAQNGTTSKTLNLTVETQITPGSTNLPPTLDPIPNLALQEEDPAQTIYLTGITAGPGERQTLTITATSSNPGLIPQPQVAYTYPDTTALLTLAPKPNASGSASITVTVDDGQPTNNLVRRTFTVNVAPVNDPPTINPIADLVLPVNSPARTVSLSGISSGAPDELQAVSITASSSNPFLMPNPTVTYRIGNSIGSLTLTPTAGLSGIALITVTANDGQPTNNIAIRQFMVTVGHVEPVLLSLSAQSSVIPAGESGSIPLLLDSNYGLTNLTFAVDFPSNRFANVSIQSLASELAPVNSKFSAYSGNSLLIQLGAKSGQTIRRSGQLALLTLTTLPGQPSAFVPITIRQIGAVLSSGAAAVLTNSASARITILGNEPLLEPASAPSTSQKLTLYARQNSVCVLEYSTDLVHWTRLSQRVPLTNTSVVVSGLNPPPKQVFYRAATVVFDPPLLEPALSAGNARVLRVFGKPNTSYTIEYSTNTGPSRIWQPLTTRVMSGAFISEPVPDLGPLSLFRVRRN